MALWVQISPGSKEPLYVQIASQISRAIALGHLRPGDKLPPVRKLAEELVINPNTVARAYLELEQQGFVASKTGSGTFVLDPALQDNKDLAQLNLLGQRIDTLIVQGLNLGLTPEKLIEFFENRVRRFLSEQNKRSP
ncbi:MAG TPA: GntR family transcriptional regulator [Anaerohalosphaeraceae bacterium]|nr:GntR family transcriptional regulator [Anaerohalosphaeraceae bacterium]HOL89013.1 GntR family transcriptional regulator [Anaerohalosphaeraceae bacterium]HPP56464.1 GntR family transcriptional regulator [Anaerohalosphaeraceae bacterium]